MIPKKIHYCWFGRGQKSELILKCIESWKKYCPDYEIIEWNEDNLDVNATLYTKQAYENKKWAFVSDYARLYALYNEGGVYFDTDVEVLKPIDEFLKNKSFTGFEVKDSPVTAVMGACAGDSVIKMLLDYYDGAKFINDDGTMNMVTNTHIITEDFIKNGVKLNGKLQTIKNMTIYPQIVFCPNNFSRIFNKPSKKSYTIHHFDQSWKNSRRKDSFLYRVRRYVIGLLRNTIGTNRLESIASSIK
ncbi:MAG: glycosyl transferase [Ruminococcaceae bacterium]|nr:glycosyl transferase [Oscillospiraceae bacterium]